MSRSASGVAVVLLAATALGACDRVERTTMSHRSSEDGVYTIHVQTTVEADLATFRCLASRSGTCRILVYERTCKYDVSLRKGHFGEDCETRALQGLELHAGERRVVAGLPKAFKECVAFDAMPTLPAGVM